MLKKHSPTGHNEGEGGEEEKEHFLVDKNANLLDKNPIVSGVFKS